MKRLLALLPALALSAPATTSAPPRPLVPHAAPGGHLGYPMPCDTTPIHKGLPAPAIKLLDNAGKSVSLSSFKGKVVYLDFWGTWCRPCMREMTEFAPALKKQFEGREVVFLYISVGDPEAKWKQVIAEQHLDSPNSVHLHATSSDLACDYAVNGYPSYYLIGRDGRFVQPYAPRPSQGAKTVAAIEAALRQ